MLFATLVLFASFLVGSVSLVLGQVPSPQAKPKLFVISENDCRLLSQHWPRADVTYKPGIGAGGQPVSPADLDGGYSEFNFPNEVTFNLLIKLRDDALLEPEGSVGQVSVDLDSGIVSLNDNALVLEEQTALIAFCQSL